MSAPRAGLACAVIIALLHASACGATTTDRTDWDDLSSFEDKFPPPCPALTELVRFVYANKACTASSDCARVDGCWEVKEHCGGALYLSSSAPSAQLEALKAGANACTLTAPCCGALPVEPACVHGACMPAPDAWVETCLQEIGETSPCALCLCATDSGDADCARTPACAPIFQCARQAGCFGTLACDLASKTFPCRKEVDAAGGPKSEIATMYRMSNVWAVRSGCDVACGK